MVIGILAVQGAFIEHEKILEKLGIPSFQIRQKKDLLKPMDGLILPGGESTAMGKLLIDLDIMNPLREKITQGLPVMGTCAGMILLAKSIKNDTKTHLGVMDIEVTRNAYGRQLSSFITENSFDQQQINMTFIRAPYISDKSSNVSILSTVDEKWVAAKQNQMLATAFHPELTSDTYVHEYFLKMVSSSS